MSQVFWCYATRTLNQPQEQTWQVEKACLADCLFVGSLLPFYKLNASLTHTCVCMCCTVVAESETTAWACWASARPLDFVLDSISAFHVIQILLNKFLKYILSVYVCVGGEKETETDRYTQRQTDMQRETDRHRGGKGGRESTNAPVHRSKDNLGSLFSSPTMDPRDCGWLRYAASAHSLTMPSLWPIFVYFYLFYLVSYLVFFFFFSFSKIQCLT